MKTPEGRALEYAALHHQMSAEEYREAYGRGPTLLEATLIPAIREARREALEDASRRAKGEPPAGGEGAVRTLQALLRGGGRGVDSLVAAELGMVVSYVDHLEARLLLLSQEEEGQAYARGYDEGRGAGWREARARCMEAAAGCREDVADLAIDRRVPGEAPR